MVGASAAVLMLIAVVVSLTRGREPQTSKRSSDRTSGRPVPALMRLSIELPCAIRSEDAIPFYAALRRRDRASLTAMMVHKKIWTIHTGTALAISQAKGIATVSFGVPGEPRLCFIPSDVVPAIERKAYR